MLFRMCSIAREGQPVLFKKADELLEFSLSEMGTSGRMVLF